ncbi:MAG: hypothetical protein ABJG68_02235 [Crocinitomicaceae bacterium]
MKKTYLIISIMVLTGLTSCKKEGCTDPAADNYSQNAQEDDGSCDYTVEALTEDITTPTTLGGNMIEVCGDISVSSDLTIQAGATLVMCAGASITIEETGYLNAVGTASSPIVFKGATETKGFWEGIAIKSNNPNNKLEYVTVKDAGTYWGWEFANVFVKSGAKLELRNSTIDNSDNIGLFVSESATLSNFSNNTFSNNTTGLDLHVANLDEIDESSNYNQGNTNDFINVRSGTISSDANWVATTTPYLFSGVYIEAGVSIDPGAILLMEADSYIQVNSTGYLNATGTTSEKIEIKGRYASPGFWDGMKIGSNNPNNQLANAIISDGGSYWGYDYANIYLDGALVMDDCQVSNANSWGLNITNSSSINSGGSNQTDAAGVESNNTFSNNGTGSNASCSNGCGVNFE